MRYWPHWTQASSPNNCAQPAPGVSDPPRRTAGRAGGGPAQATRKLERLADLYLDSQIEPADYRARRAGLAALKTALERELLGLDNAASEPPPDLLQLYRVASADERRELIRCLTERREAASKQICIKPYDTVI